MKHILVVVSVINYTEGTNSHDSDIIQRSNKH